MKKVEINGFESVVENYDNRYYTIPYAFKNTLKPDTVIDEDKSVKWNREEVERLNKENATFVESINKLRITRRNELFDDLKAVLKAENKMTDGQAQIVVDKAWAEAHSEGIKNVIIHIEELVEFISDFNKA